MTRTLLRAHLLAMTLLLLGALPALAQIDERILDLRDDTGSVLVGVRNDVALPAGQEADAVVVVSGTALVEGRSKSLVAVDSDVILRGPEASVERAFIAGGTLVIEGGASAVDVAYVGTDMSGLPAGAVSGRLVDAEEELVGAFAVVAAALLVIGLLFIVGGFIATLVATLLVIAFGTSQTRRAAATIGNDVLKVIVVGLLMLIVPGILIGLLFVSILGIPLALGLGWLWGIVAFLGYIVAGLWLGEQILRRSRSAARPYGAAFLGVLILMLLTWTVVVPMLASIFGMGAVTLAGWRVLRGRGAPPMPPGYAGPWGAPSQVPPPAWAPPPYSPPPPGGWPPQQGGPPASWG